MGRILSRRPESSLASLGLTVGGVYKILVISRPHTHQVFRITAHILCSLLPPIQIPMHASSPSINVKNEVREMLHTPALFLSLHAADGKLRRRVAAGPGRAGLGPGLLLV